MKTCPYCAHDNREGVFFCEECGHPFVTYAPAGGALNTMQFSMEQAADYGPGRVAWGTARFDTGSAVVLHFRGFPEPLTLEPGEELLLGRGETGARQGLDVDLSPYGAAESGVSRLHGAIRRGEDTLTLVDLDSTNGTYLNGQRLIPHQPRVLRDGDEVRMGRLTFHIYFK